MKSAPVVTLLSKSPDVARRTQSLLRSLFGMKPVVPLRRRQEEGDELDKIFPPFLGWRMRWDSVASQCASSGAVLHLLSPSCQSSTDFIMSAGGGSPELSVLSVTNGIEEGGPPSGEEASLSVHKSRHQLALRMHELGNDSTTTAMKTMMRTSLGQKLNVSHLLGSCSKSGLPFLDLPSTECGENNTVFLQKGKCHLETETMGTFKLREIALPYFDDATYEDGSTLFSRLGHSALSRPKTGLYQWPQSGIAIRPLPAAKEDLTLAPPSFVFHCESLDDAQKIIDSSGANSAKVGFSGHDRKGQLIVRHQLLAGLDFRMCEASALSSTFAEAQESLLAGSLDDLQSANVLGGTDEGSTGVRGHSDAMNGLGDCWIEFRANCRKPSGFLNKGKNVSSKRIVKAPSIPYE